LEILFKVIVEMATVYLVGHHMLILVRYERGN